MADMIETDKDDDTSARGGLGEMRRSITAVMGNSNLREAELGRLLESLGRTAEAAPLLHNALTTLGDLRAPA